MPLIKGRSKKAFEHNIEAEMHAGKPKDQSLAIAYSVKRKPKKKMASGGSVESGSRDMNYADGGEADDMAPQSRINPEFLKAAKEAEKRRRAGVTKHTSPDYETMDLLKAVRAGKLKPKYAEGGEIDEETQVIPDKGFGKIIRVGMAEGGSVKDEKRPMLENEYNDSKEIAKNKGKKALIDSDWTDNPTIRQAQKPSLVPLSRPKMAGSDVFSVRDRDDVEKDLHRMDSEAPASPKEQPRGRYDEEGAKRQGPAVSDMADEHSTHDKPYKQEIEDQYAQDEAESDMEQSYAKGGQVETSDYSHPENKYEHDFAGDTPSEDEGHIYANALNEEGPDRQGPPKSDNEKPHSKSSLQYRDSESYDRDMELNPAHDKHSADDSESQPKDEADEEVYNSIAAAIMAKKDRESKQYSDSDIDEMIHMYEGGEITRKSGKINGMDSIYTHEDADQADLSRNAEEDANLEDQASYDALRKENYSESEGLAQMSSPKDSNRLSDEEEMDSHDRHDMVDEIRRKMKARKQFKRD